jgi:hypothetical protein
LEDQRAWLLWAGFLTLGFAGVFPSEKIRRKQSKRNGKKQFNME